MQDKDRVQEFCRWQEGVPITNRVLAPCISLWHSCTALWSGPGMDSSHVQGSCPETVSQVARATVTPFPGELGVISFTHFILHLRAPEITTPGPCLQHCNTSTPPSTQIKALSPLSNSALGETQAQRHCSSFSLASTTQEHSQPVGRQARLQELHFSYSQHKQRDGKIIPRWQLADRAETFIYS